MKESCMKSIHAIHGLSENQQHHIQKRVKYFFDGLQKRIKLVKEETPEEIFYKVF